MNKYYIGIYSETKPFDKRVVWKSLEVVFEQYPEFFPAKLEIAPQVHHEISSPSDFSYDLIPSEFWIEKDISVNIPIEGNNRAELSILDDRNSTVIPSSLLLVWYKKEILPDTEVIERIFAGLIEALNPTSAIVTQSEMRLREDIYDRSFLIDSSELPEALNWMTWLGPKHIAKIGESKIEKIKDFVSIVSCTSGFILTLMQEPYDDDNPEHLAFREKMEDKLGLTKIYRKLQSNH